MKQVLAELAAIPGNLNPVGTTLTNAAPVDPMVKPLWEIDDRFINPFAAIPEVQTWCMMGDRKAIDKQGIITFSAKPKQGKSISIYAILTAIIAGKQFSTITPTADRPRLAIVFDTEMNPQTLQKRMAIMQSALGENAPKFQVVSLLSVKKSDRRAIIDDITNKYNPDIVVIDQVARLVKSFNDESESSEFGEWLCKLAATRTALVVIHQNKAADNTQMKGHLGSILEELAVENYSVARKNGVFEATPTNARNSAIDEDTAKFSFALDNAGNIIDATAIMNEQRQKEIDDWRNNFARIFGEDTKLRYSELKKRIMEREGVNDTAAETKITAAKKRGVIVKAGEGTMTPWQLAPLS
jgi:hypothetical protein